jgi:dihydroorotase
MISLETMFGVLLSCGLSVDAFVKMQTINARHIFGLAVPEIKEGEMATLTLFTPGAEYVFEEKMIRSKSKNSPFIGKTLKGKVFGIINKNKFELINYA